MADPTCSAIARAAGESLIGTASRVRAWILLQQPGPWGADALNESRLDAAIARRLGEHARRHGVRVLLLRRYGAGATELRPRCYLAHTGPRTSFLEGRHLDSPEELLDVDLVALRRGERPGFGRLMDRPLYLICTNGRHDQCCATRGRPLAQAMDRVYRDRAWESSHVGGCRFAGNLVCFPHGLYFGEVEAGDGPRIAADYERGLIDLEHYRGRPSYDTLVQAAECFVRRAEGLRQVDDLVLERRDALGDREVSVQFAARSGIRYRARVRATPAPLARRLTCHATGPQHPPVYDLLDLQAVAAAS